MQWGGGSGKGRGNGVVGGSGPNVYTAHALLSVDDPA